MKILIYPWQAYNYADIENAFLRSGCECVRMDYHLADYEEDDRFLEYAKKLISGDSFDLVFSVNYFPIISVVCEETGIPYVSWTCDNPLISMYHSFVFNDCNIIFTFDRTNHARFKAMGVKHIYYLPLAVDTQRIDSYLSSQKDIFLYKNDISFVGSLYERNTFDLIYSQLSDYLKGYLEAVICAQKQVSGGNIIESMLTDEVMLMVADSFKLDKSKDSFSSLALIFSTTVLGFKVASEIRQEALVALGRKFQTALFTNSRDMGLAGVEFRGEVDYFTEMPKVFNASRINLNFTIPNIVSGIPLRAFDIMGAGGFLLSDHRAEYPLFFKRGEDYDSFEDMDELTEKCDFYLRHDDIRARIAQSGHEKVSKYHNYDRRIASMLAMVRELPASDDPMLFESMG